MPANKDRGFSRVRQRLLSRLASTFNPGLPRLGIDIGSEQIKVVECLARDGQLWVRNALRFDTPPEVMSTHAIRDAEVLGRVIRSNLDRAQVTAQGAVTAIPGPSAMIKRFNIGAADVERLEAVVRSELESLVPDASDSLCVDYQVSERVDADGLEVIVVAARSELVGSYADALERAGLAIEAVDVDCLALANMLGSNPNHSLEASRTVALVHIGARFSSVIINSHGRSVFVGDVPAGTRSATENSDPGEGAWADRVAAEIESALRFYWPASAGDCIEEILLSGGGAQERGFSEALARRTGLRVSTVEPFDCMRHHADWHPETASSGARFAVAVGLVVRALPDP